jgi:hypothetical protein
MKAPKPFQLKDNLGTKAVFLILEFFKHIFSINKINYIVFQKLTSCHLFTDLTRSIIFGYQTVLLNVQHADEVIL